MSGRLEGKAALVTGASSGLGRATALMFAGEGASVVVASHREAETKATARLIRDGGGHYVAVPTDVSFSKQVEAIVDPTISTCSRLDIAFNNTGIFGLEGPIHRSHESQWDSLIHW